jgi:very-short-patch-repair endonuclease
LLSRWLHDDNQKNSARNRVRFMGSPTANQTEIEKNNSLLQFLRQLVRLRRKRKAAYGVDDRILWLDELVNLREDKLVRSPFFEPDGQDLTDSWLEIRRPLIPDLPVLPPQLKPWIRLEDLRDPTCEPAVELPGAQEQLDSEDSAGTDPAGIWQQYLEHDWRAWADKARRLWKVQEAYEQLDFIRRRIEEAEESYELVLGLGLVVWKDPLEGAICRHLLVAPAEISLNASIAVFSVTPAASLERFNVELDMFELQRQPRLDRQRLDPWLEDLTGQPWNVECWEDITKEIANRIDPKAEVIACPWRDKVKPDATLRVYYAPALILRQRRLLAYDELVEKLIEQSENGKDFALTQPWLRLIREGSSPVGDVDCQEQWAFGDSRLYFPLPQNDEQRRIAQSLAERPYVLVKGPPGTGKSHTIANLICHLLAQGGRVLITAHAPKALEILLDLLPQEIGRLCVTALGSTREDERRLEESVRTILGRKDSFPDVRQSAARLEQMERELRELEEEVARLDREMRECREAETYTHRPYAGYEGTASQIAQLVEKEREIYGWFPDLPDEDSRCPLRPEEILFLAETHSKLNETRIRELSQEIGAESLPSPEQFTAALNELAATEQEYREACASHGAGELRFLHRVNTEGLARAREFLTSFHEQAMIAQRRLGALTDILLADLLAGKREEWAVLASELDRILVRMREAMQQRADARVELPRDLPVRQLKADAGRRLEHFAMGGRRGFGPLAPSVVRATRYVETSCRVNGLPPRRAEQLQQLIAFLEFEEALEGFEGLWRVGLDVPRTSHSVILSHLTAAVEQLRRILNLFEDPAHHPLGYIAPSARQTLHEEGHRLKWLALLGAELTRRRLEAVRARIDGWVTMVDRVVALGNTHRCMLAIQDAVHRRDAAAYAAAWQTRERVRKEKQITARYEELLGRLQREHPALVQRIRETQGDPSWRDRWISLERAWLWAAANKWLQKVSDPRRYEDLTRLRQRKQQQMEKKLLELASEKAWLHLFERLDDATQQHLTAWTKAMSRIGAGTGIHAHRHRRQARQYLVRCLPCMPAWIMPLHKVWETVEARPGLFDTVIVDEASQAGVDSLLVLLLARRIVVVGDDQQNSPEAVGVAEEDIKRLIRDHLGQFTFAAEFRPDTSLYDHAERAFGQPISLREHFRCVREIIRFSNELCYRQAPLIPLRQPPPERLEPIKTTFVSDGKSGGEGQKLVNEAEADAIVDQIQLCIKDERYADKTMGVIVLQGRRQAEIIEDRLAQALTPKLRGDHRIRCGVPATFQGDQRDVIFLSMVVAPNQRFRALTEIEARRRFNVAMSRARDQVWLFHSVELGDLNPEDLRHRLLRFCLEGSVASLPGAYEDWERLERELRNRWRSPGTQPEPYESWFEVDVACELLRRGYRLLPQYEFAGYRIDLVVEGYGNRLALECDGDAWHGAQQFEHDMHRQRQLERAGWNFVRVRASEFYANRARAIDRIVEACEELDILPTDAAFSAPAKALPTQASSGEPQVCETQAVAGENDEEFADQPALEQATLATPLPDPRVAPVGAVREALLDLIAKEGPLNKRLLYRLYRDNCPHMGRTTQTVRTLLNRALYQLQGSNQVVVVDELGDRTLESQVVRLANSPPARVRPGRRRDLLEIPPSELLSLREMLRSSVHAGSEDDEPMMRAVLQFYGFERLTKRWRQYLDRVFRCILGSACAI